MDLTVFLEPKLDLERLAAALDGLGHEGRVHCIRHWGRKRQEEIFEAVEVFYRRYYLRPRPILRIIKTMLEDKDVCVRRLREGYEFFRTMSQRRNDLSTQPTAA